MGLCALSLICVSPAFALSVTVHGGAGRVGGSCASVQSGEAHVLVDCGALGGDGEDTRGEARAVAGFPFDPVEVDALCLTHAHQDHAGRVPSLVHAGFRGRIYMTEATRDLLAVSWDSQILYDTTTVRAWRWSVRKESKIYLHWRTNCAWSVRISKKNLRTFNGTYDAVVKSLEDAAHPRRRVLVCGACREAEVADLLSRVTCVSFGETNRIAGLSVVFSPTKHLPGAAAVWLADQEVSCLFSGDLGTCRSRLVTNVPAGQPADAVFVESTYGAACDASLAETEVAYRRFRTLVGETVKKGGVAWVPAFALDRTQRVLLEIKKGMAAGEIPSDAPIYLLSPSARENTALYGQNADWFDVPQTTELTALLAQARQTLNPKDASKLSRAILVTTSGMMDTASSLALLPTLAPRSDVTICLVGYQAPGTPGDRLTKGAKTLTLKIKDQKTSVKVNATVERFSCFGGHADAREIDAWLALNLKSKIYLVHGGEKALAERRADLVSRLGCDAAIAKSGEKLEIKKKEDVK